MLSLPILFKYVLLFLSFSYISTFFTPTYKTPSFYLSSSISYFLSLFYSSPSPTYILLSTLSFFSLFCSSLSTSSSWPPSSFSSSYSSLSTYSSAFIFVPITYLPLPHSSHTHLPHYHLNQNHRSQIIQQIAALMPLFYVSLLWNCGIIVKGWNCDMV